MDPRAPGEAPGGVITLLTDFGLEDAYVGVLKGVILSIHPRATLVDLSHSVRPQGLREAAFLLRVSAEYFPPGTVHLAVVDPGVGTGRRVLAARSGVQRFVGPDNGLLSWCLGPDARVVSVERKDLFPSPASATFHGRDLFAPVAARLALGMPLEDLGPEVGDPVRIPEPHLRVSRDRIEGEVLMTDHFGNLITSIPGRALDGWAAQAVRAHVGPLVAAGLKRTFADGERGEAIAYLGSAGYLELARVGGSAAAGMPAAIGMRVNVVRFGEPSTP